MEAGPVDPAVVALEHVLDDAVGLAEEVGAAGVLEVVVQPAGAGRHVLLAQACNPMF